MNNWRSLFERHILERGYGYYESGAVIKIVEAKDGFYALVNGTEDYQVKIETSHGIIREMYCSCPYAEGGSRCKHMAAVLYGLEERKDGGMIDEEQDVSGSGQKSSGSGQRISRSGQELSDVIQKIPEEEVRQWLLELAEADEHLRNRILTQYAEGLDERHMLRLKRELDDIACRNSDCYGFVGWNQAGAYVEEMEDFLDDNVRVLIEKGYCAQAFELTNAVFIKGGNQDMDDSGGESRQLADSCYEYWKVILENCSDEEKEKMFGWFEQNQSAGIVADYMEEYIEDFLMNEFHEEKFLRRKLAMLDEQLKDKEEEGDNGHWMAHYGYEVYIVKKLEIMKELHYPQEEIEKYKKDNWSLAAVRRMEIEECIEAGRLLEAVHILQESKILDKHVWRWVADYSTKLIELYRSLGMEREYKEELVFQVFRCGQKDLEFADRLKTACRQEEWVEYREQLLSRKNGWTMRYPLMVKEGLHKRLLEEIAEEGSAYYLDQYEDVLKEKFPKQVMELYVKYVKKRAEQVFDRSGYKVLAQYLKKISKYPGGGQTARELAEEWQKVYRRRPAMMDELRKAGF